MTDYEQALKNLEIRDREIIRDQAVTIERLRAIVEENAQNSYAAIHAAEARLATAVGLLAQAPHAPGLRGQEWSRRRDALLASAQPAAPARVEAECPVHGEECLGLGDDCRLPTRTEAEQAVLAAAKAWFDGWQEQHGPCYLLAPHPAQDAALWAAELALRGLK